MLHQLGISGAVVEVAYKDAVVVDFLGAVGCSWFSHLKSYLRFF